MDWGHCGIPDNRPMPDRAHLLIPFATCASAAATEVLRTLPLPNLEKLLSRLTATATDTGSPEALSPPHERALARACGLPALDGQLPWAAWQARDAGLGSPGDAWAWITPCHWQIGRDHHVLMQHPMSLQLDAADAQALMAAMQEFFAEDGITLVGDAPTLWLARGELFRDLATASLDRVIGQPVDPWFPRGDAARELRRLQSEMQMLLYTHPVNAARERGGLLPVNSFWASGAGALPPGAGQHPPGLRVTHKLRDAALLGQWPAWADAWCELDSGECARLLGELDAGRSVTLTLCGERSAQTFETRPKSLFRQISSRLARPSAAAVLEPL